MSFPTLMIDVNTGEALRLDGSVFPRLKFYEGDKIAMTIGFFDSLVNVTAAVFPNGSIMKVGVKSAAADSPLLAGSSSFSGAGSFVVGVLDFSNEALSDYFDNDVGAAAISAGFVFEVKVTSGDQSTTQTYFQDTCIIARSVILPNDIAVGPDFSAADFSAADFKTT